MKRRDTHHHAYLIPLISIHFHSVVNHKIHELIEPPKCSNNHAIGIELDYNTNKHRLSIIASG